MYVIANRVEITKVLRYYNLKQTSHTAVTQETLT